MALNPLLISLTLLVQVPSWQSGKVHVYLDEPLGYWIETVSGHKRLVLQSTWYNQDLYHDAQSHSLMFFATDGFVVLIGEHGNLRSKIPVNDIGSVRNCFVRNGSAVFDEGIRSTGTWSPGPGIVQWLKKSRDVCCIDLVREDRRNDRRG